MLGSADVSGSPDWYLLRLGKALSEETPRLNRLLHYDCGDHPLPTGNIKLRETYRRFQKMSRTNYVGLIAESVRERCRPIGFVSGGDSLENGNDEVAWGLWQANYLDADCSIVHHTALSLSRAYVMVGPNPDDPSTPFITTESPFQVFHEYDPIRPRWVRAAIKTWFDELTNRRQAVLQLPDRFVYYEAVKEGEGQGDTIWEASAWMQTRAVRNPWGEVLVVPFINRRERGGMGEFEDVTDVQDRINATTLDRLVIQAMQSYRQRWAKGVQVEDENGNPTRPFDPGADLLWLVEDENAMFGDFQQAEIGPIVSAIANDVTQIAAISRTPPHYLLANVANVSGDALAAAEVGLTAKVRDRLMEFGEGWEKVLRLAAKVAKKTLPADGSMVWADPERHTLAELADALPKFKAADIPFTQRAQLAGYDPQTIKRMRSENEAEQKKQLQQQQAQLKLQAKFNPPAPPGQQPGSAPTKKPPAQ